MPDPGHASLRRLGDRRRWIVTGVFAAGFLFAVINAALAPFWFDELLTFHVSRLGSPAEIGPRWSRPPTDSLRSATSSPRVLRCCWARTNSRPGCRCWRRLPSLLTCSFCGSPRESEPCKTPPAAKTEGGFPVEETVAMWALTLSPAVTALAAMWTTEAYVLRYSLPAALGLARIYAVFAHHCTRKRPRAAWVVVGIVAVSFAGQGVMRGSDLVTGYMRGFRTGSTFASIERLGPESGLPIVVTSPVEYFVFPALRSRALAIAPGLRQRRGKTPGGSE